MLSQGLLLLNSILFPKCYQCRTILLCIWKRTLPSSSAVQTCIGMPYELPLIKSTNLQQIGSKQRVQILATMTSS